MKQTLSALLQQFVDRVDLPVSRLSSQAQIPKQTLFNWLGGRMPRWHPQLPTDLERLSAALGLNQKENDALLQAAGCVCAVDTPQFEESTMGKYNMPRGWIRAGSKPSHYHMGVDPKMFCQENAAALVQGKAKSPEGFGTLMQSCKPGEYLGKRVRFSAMARLDKIEDWAGLWFRIDGPKRNESLQFDNMGDRQLKGTKDWERYSLVLDVAEEAVGLAYGVLLSGKGCVWIADVRLEVVGPEVPVTNMNGTSRGLPDAPVNLSFSETA